MNTGETAGKASKTSKTSKTEKHSKTGRLVLLAILPLATLATLGVWQMAGSTATDLSPPIPAVAIGMDPAGPPDSAAALTEAPAAGAGSSSLNTEEVAHLKGDLAELREAMLVLVEHQSRTQKAIASIQRSLDNPAQLTDTKDAESNQETEQAAEQRMLEGVANIENELEAQAVDPIWAEQTLGKIEQQLAMEEMSGFNLVEAKCGSTLCKLEVKLDPKLSREEGLQRLAQHRSWDGPTFVSVGANGQTRLLFAREGHKLPE